MSNRAVSLVWESGPNDQIKLLTLLAIADDGDNDGEGCCRIDPESLAPTVRMTVPQCRDAIYRLVCDGWLAETPNHPYATHRLNLEKLSGGEVAA